MRPLMREVVWVLVVGLVACAHGSARPPSAPASGLPTSAEPLVVTPGQEHPEQVVTNKPLVLNVVPEHLQVSFVQTSIETHDGKRPVWHWVSSGLKALYQPEIAITLLAESADVLPKRMGWVAGYYQELYGYAERGNLVEAGSLVSFGAEGAFGRPELHGILFVDSDGSGELDIPPDTLSGLFLTKDEVAVASDMGPSRLLNAWAMADHYFPYPFWSEVAHQSRVTPEQLKSSILTHTHRSIATDCSVVLEGGKRLVVRARKKTRDQFKRLAEVPLEEPVALLTGLDSEADSSLVWVPGSQDVNVIGAGNEQKRLTGAFIGFAANAKMVQVTPVEDGFFAVLAPDSWKALRQALLDGQPFTQKFSEGIPELSLEWID